MGKERIGKYLTVDELGNEGRKTRRWLVLSNHNAELGEILWETGWRQYVFVPSEETIFSAGCIDDLSAFLKRANADQKAGINRATP